MCVGKPTAALPCVTDIPLAEGLPRDITPELNYSPTPLSPAFPCSPDRLTLKRDNATIPLRVWCSAWSHLLSGTSWCFAGAQASVNVPFSVERLKSTGTEEQKSIPPAPNFPYPTHMNTHHNLNSPY